MRSDKPPVAKCIDLLNYHFDMFVLYQLADLTTTIKTKTKKKTCC